MRKIQIIFSFLFLINIPVFSESTSIVDRIFETNYQNMIRPEGSNAYVGTLFVRDGKLYLYYESMGFTPTIMGFKIIENKLHMLIKSRWTGAEEPYEDEKFIVNYYEIVLNEENEQINYSCQKLTSVDIADYNLFPATVNANYVNTRTNPSLNGSKMKQRNDGDQLTISGVSKNYDEIGEMADYWFEFIESNQKLWIYGYFTDYVKTIDFDILKSY